MFEKHPDEACGRVRRFVALLGGASSALALVAFAVAPTAGAAGTAAPFADILIGEANGGHAQLTNSAAPDITVGQIADQTMPCVPDSGVKYTNQVLSVLAPSPSGVQLSNVLSTGTVVNTGVATFNASAASVSENSTVQSLSILSQPNVGALVSADAVSATSTMSENAGGSPAPSGSTSIANLHVLGLTITTDPNPAPNTKITIPGIGYLVLNEQGFDSTGQNFIVRALRLHLDNLLGYTGDLVIAEASTRIQSSTGRLLANAFELSAKASVGSIVASVGAQNWLALPCAGSNGVQRTRNGVGVTQAGLLSADTLQSVVNGSNTPPGQEFTYARASIAHVNLLGGRVTADAVTVQANTAQGPANLLGDKVFSNASNVTLANVKIDLNGDGTSDLTINGTPAPNTTYNLLNLGKITLNAETCSVDSGATRSVATCAGKHQTRYTVTGILIKVTVGSGSLAVGSEIRVSQAASGLSA